MTTDQRQSLVAVVGVVLFFAVVFAFVRLTRDIVLPGWLPMAGLVVAIALLFGPIRLAWRRAQRRRELDR